MHAVYLSTNGDTTTFLPSPLEVQGYGCGVIDLDGIVTIPDVLIKSETEHDETIHDVTEKENIYTPIHNPSQTPLLEGGKIKPLPIPPTSNDGLKKYTDTLYLCCDIIPESSVGNLKMPVLRYLKRKNGRVIGDIYNVIWLNVIRPSIASIRLYIADDRGKIVSLEGNTLKCTLLFIPHR